MLDFKSRADIEALSESRYFRARVTRVLGFAYELMLGSQGSRAMLATDFYREVGNVSKPLGQYFKTFFIQSGKYTKGGATYQYEVNDARLQALEDWNKRCGKSEVTFSSVSGAQGKSFLIPPGPRANLPRTGDRVYPWWATMRSTYRHRLFLEQHGSGFDHDIENAKGTLLLQYWDRYVQIKRTERDKNGKPIPGGYARWMASTDLTLPTWRRYVHEKDAVRQELATDLGISVQDAKQVLQSLMGGAWYSPKDSSLSAYPNLIGNPIYEGLRADVKLMWSVLQVHANEGETGAEFLARLYLGLEDRVMSVIAEVVEPDQEAWWVHDGFITKSRVKNREVELEVEKKTGYKIRLKTNQLRAEGENTSNDFPHRGCARADAKNSTSDFPQEVCHA